MTTNDLDAITARADAASPGEWSCFDENNGEGAERHWTVSNDVWAGGNDTPEGAAAMHTDEWLSRADAEFIAHSREDVPALVAEVRELRAWRDTVALGLGYAEQVGSFIKVAPAEHVVDGMRQAALTENHDRVFTNADSELDGATDPGPEGSSPGTPGEFAARWNAWDQERRAEWLRRRVQSAETASLCVMQDHAGALYQVTHVLPDALRREQVATMAGEILGRENWRLRKLLKRRMRGREFRRKVQGGRR